MSLVLGIETSCDDTSVAVLEDARTLRSHLIAGQDLHRLYGGVVPELAARAHLELLPRLVEAALAEARVAPGDLTAVAVTRAPGLVEHRPRKVECRGVAVGGQPVDRRTPREAEAEQLGDLVVGLAGGIVAVLPSQR